MRRKFYDEHQKQDYERWYKNKYTIVNTLANGQTITCHGCETKEDTLKHIIEGAT